MSRPETRDPRVIRPNPNQPRKAHDPEAFRLLVDSLKLHGVLQPVGILSDNTNAWGFRRVQAAIEAGLAEIPVVVLPAAAATGPPEVLALVENIVRSELTQPEVLLGLENVLRLNASWNQKTLAANLGLRESTVCRYLTVGRHTALREPFLAGKLNLAVAYQIATAGPGDQARLLGLALTGPVTREQVTRAARVRQPAADAVRQTRIVCPLASGPRVTVTGAAMTLDGYIEALASALDAARKASRESLDVKTAEKVWRDKARAAG